MTLCISRTSCGDTSINHLKLSLGAITLLEQAG